MLRSLEREAMARSIRFAAALIIAVLPTAPSLAQAPGYVTVNLAQSAPATATEHFDPILYPASVG